MRNVLLVGATGMLKGLAPKLLHDYYQVFVIGRDPQKFAPMAKDAGERAEYLTCMAIDYHQYDRLGQWVAHLQLMRGPLDAVVAWVHGPANPVLEAIALEVERYRQSPWDLYHILPMQAAAEPPEPPTGITYGRYRSVILGYMPEGGATRWLTHEEIVDGVYDALQSSENRRIVGVVEPLASRPSGAQ